ncbi:MAG: hypothetical protein ACYTG1_07640 [Planctomycetota bacterium]|jgi:hypothetical protein
MDPRTDRIAREAARLLETGEASAIGEAIRAASEALDLADAPRPGAGRVRQHVQGMSMQALGADGYEQRTRAILEAAESLMTLLEHALDDAATVLVGRAARGRLDGPGPVHVRVYTTARVRELADVLLEHGYEEPVFETADTRLGRLDRIRLVDDGTEIVLTRCRPEQRASAGRNLFDDAPIETLDLEGLRRRMEDRAD